MVGIRNSAKAIILHNQHSLAVKKQDNEGFYYLLPGGGQEHGENLHQALARECIEVINAELMDLSANTSSVAIGSYRR
ncbi:NUDIX domain-containing protein [Gracilibacillus alcaliphilus]|uniref:NUDIX domain-containing protein n=1 Tax=Gracilibacillus alcaliphilus TaxID=1401441 RepID=UPI00195E5ED1|nr:NUDIX domain-containing protein [Gracilibacillus alcaliphilus]MBM7676446.1 ADP-ribose pyrophosphatase YjhB (NUDIX family) [Gracilibacillus alcaliphilus]